MLSKLCWHAHRYRVVTALVLWASVSPITLSATPRVDDDLRVFLTQTIAKASSFDDRFDAQVWLVDMQQRLAPFVANPEERLELLIDVHQAATESGLPPELVLALIEVESNFDRFALSRAGAQGYMQVMPFGAMKLDALRIISSTQKQTCPTAVEFCNFT